MSGRKKTSLIKWLLLICLIARPAFRLGLRHLGKRFGAKAIFT